MSLDLVVKPKKPVSLFTCGKGGTWKIMWMKFGEGGLKFIKLNYFVKVYFGLVEFHAIGK